MEESRTPTNIWKEFEKGLQYIQSSGLKAEWDECERFYEGNHWPKATEKTKNMQTFQKVLMSESVACSSPLQNRSEARCLVKAVSKEARMIDVSEGSSLVF